MGAMSSIVIVNHYDMAFARHASESIRWRPSYTANVNPRRFRHRPKRSPAGRGIEAQTSARVAELLELPKVLAQLEAQCACELGRALVRDVTPSSRHDEVLVRLEETSQARAFLASGKSAPFGGITDVKRLVKNASIGAMLEARELSAVGKFAAGARRLKESIESVFHEESSPEYSILLRHAARITPQPELEKSIAAAIDESSEEVKDNASLRLLKARRGIAQTQQEVQGRLRAMLSDTHVQPHLQDNFVTIREGRYCLPVRAESRGAVPGIVHDRSGSGGAFFIEPQAVVDLNNRLRELQLEEREAIREILTDLSTQVAAVSPQLQDALEACAALDFAFAKARLSQQQRAIQPVLAERGLFLLQARHPLVEECVPNDIRLGDEFDVLLITGPNTGGKTVVLKTLGLLTLMAMCGLHLPVEEGSTLCLPGRVWADIGDEQSIEQSLSTFSSHMTNIIGIVEHAQRGDLVLFDEIGAGTDPDEGAALAKAILRALQRKGALVLATTHYGELKQFALGSERFDNASVEFDNETLRPTYHLRIGVPGASNAIAIASRLGLSDDLAQRARKYLGRERAEAEAATQRLEETQRELREQSEETQAARNEVLRLQHEYDDKLQRLQEEREAEIAKAREEAQTVVREAQSEAERILKDLRRAHKESRETEAARGRLKTLRERTAMQGRGERVSGRTGDEVTTTEPQSPGTSPLHPLTSSPTHSLKTGDAVRVASYNKEGVLLSPPDDAGRVAVRIGVMKVEVPVQELVPLSSHRMSTSAPAFSGKVFDVPEEINLIGKRVEEAIPELEEYLDRAILANAKTLRIVHGRGTGALRRAVHEYLKSTRVVVSFELALANEGGEGATVVRF
jgi:DNA mismatch repair protein MutS2